MINTQEIKEKVLKWWSDGSFLTSYLLNEADYFPREIPKIGKVKTNSIHENYETVIKEQDALKSNSKENKGFGFTLNWQENNNQKTGKNKFIGSISISSEIDFLKFIGKEKEFNRFKTDVNFILATFPNLKGWIISNPLRIVENSQNWESILRVCKYFAEEHQKNKYYIRELPINVHTKFIERNTAIIDSILEALIPQKINQEQNRDFCSKYFLKNKEKLIRIRILCPDLKKNYLYEDFSVRLSDFRIKQIECENILIAENELNFLTLPSAQKTIALWSGGGFQISNLHGIDWLIDKRFFYWGDIDAAGLIIYQQLKSYYPNVRSIMMDRGTFEKYYSEGKATKKMPAIAFKGSSQDEVDFFNYINENLLRLEQEQIPQNYVNVSIVNALNN